MICCYCKDKQATVHLTQIAGEKMQKVDLCEECAKKKGVNEPTAFALADLLCGLGASTEMEQASGELRCPQCNFTQADFKKAGRLGCAECYKTFADGLEGLLETMHKGTKHVGKVPYALQQTRELNDRLRQLQKKLDKAVADESFEIAAQLRDEIKQTREKLTEISTP
ncbi:MAG: UvrB/UvrC motif-containing protein [Verrucomicrobia bacterium]|nr:UvrB/UvrC motif-containing protein [Verrucomicrobiota bacterium]MBI3870983.1 UvrB/UvrC motif-containing protein [Verrucomicrobiota bacterium]